MQIEFEKMSVDDLLAIYGGVIRELMQRKIISTKNVAGEIGERVVTHCLGLKRESPSNRAFDAVDQDGVRYEIRTRWLAAHNDSTELKRIKMQYVTEESFDWLIAIILNEDFTVRQVVKIPPALIPQYSGTKDGGYRLRVKAQLLADPQVQDITGLFAGFSYASLEELPFGLG